MREKLIVSIVLVLSYFFLPKYGFTGDLWGYDVRCFACHLLYPISHANIYHLLANIVCLWMITCPLDLVIAYFVCVVSSFLPCFIDEPTMGFSGMLFAIVGISWGNVRRFRAMLWRNKWFLIIPIFLPHVNAFIHLYCLLGGYLYGRLCDKR